MDDMITIRNIMNQRNDCIKVMNKTSINQALADKYQVNKMRYSEFIKRPEVSFLDICDNLSDLFDAETIDRAMIEVRYSGYINRQQRDIDKLTKYNNTTLPDSIDYDGILGLRTESRVKLNKYRPVTIFEAKKIAGIKPADIMILLSHVRS